MALSLTDRVVVQTERAAQYLEHRYRCSKLFVLPNPIEIPQNLPNFASRKKQVIYVASIGRSKNQKQLIEAFAACPTWRDWELVIVGDGPSRKAMEELATTLGIASNTKFLGQRENVRELLQDSRVFAFPSLSEGFPNALGEALANGCACISIDCPCGPSEMIRDGYNGFLVAPNAHQEFRDKLEILMNDGLICRTMSENAVTDIVRFSEADIFHKFEELVYA